MLRVFVARLPAASTATTRIVTLRVLRTRPTPLRFGLTFSFSAPDASLRCLENSTVLIDASVALLVLPSSDTSNVAGSLGVSVMVKPLRNFARVNDDGTPVSVMTGLVVSGVGAGVGVTGGGASLSSIVTGARPPPVHAPG